MMVPVTKSRRFKSRIYLHCVGFLFTHVLSHISEIAFTILF